MIYNCTMVQCATVLKCKATRTALEYEGTGSSYLPSDRSQGVCGLRR